MQHPSHEFKYSNLYSTFNEINLDELWLFGTGSNFVPIHEVVANMNPRICATLSIVYAFIRCDAVSAFCGRCKNTA